MPLLEATISRDLACHEDAWNRLLQLSSRPEIFLSFRWARALTSATGRRPIIVAVRSAGETIGLLPLSEAADTLCFVGAPAADYNDLVCAPGTANDVLRVALETLLATREIAWTQCRLDNVPEDGALGTALLSLPEELTTRLFSRGRIECPAFRPDPPTPGAFERLARKESLRRHEKRLERHGLVTFSHVTNRAQIVRHFPYFLAQLNQRRALRGQSPLAGEAARTLAGLVAELAPDNQLRFGVLSVGGVPVAYHLGFQSAGKYVWYKPSFDIGYWDDGPGEVLLRRLFLHCEREGIPEFDFTVGDEAFKHRFANVTRWNQHWVLERDLRQTRRRRWYAQAGTATRSGLAMLPSPIRLATKGAASLLRALAKASGRALRAIVQRGPRRTIGGWLRRLGSSLYQRREVLVYSRPSAGTAAGGLLEGEHRLVEGSLRDVGQLLIDFPDHFIARHFWGARDRFRRSDKLFIARREGRVVHTCWIGRRNSLELGYDLGTAFELPLPSDSWLIYDCWTPPEARGRGIYQASLDFLVSQVADGGPVYIYAFADNHASCRGIERAPFTLRRRIIARHWLPGLARLRVSSVVVRDVPPEALPEPV